MLPARTHAPTSMGGSTSGRVAAIDSVAVGGFASGGGCGGGGVAGAATTGAGAAAGASAGAAGGAPAGGSANAGVDHNAAPKIPPTINLEIRAPTVPSFIVFPSRDCSGHTSGVLPGIDFTGRPVRGRLISGPLQSRFDSGHRNFRMSCDHPIPQVLTNDFGPD